MVKADLMTFAVLLFLIQGCAGLKRFAYEGFRRDGWQKPEMVLQALDVRPGQSVADLGAGGGYFTFRLADAVGKKGRVYAVDIDSDMTEYLKERAAEKGYKNVEVVLAAPDDPRLPGNGIDLLFTCNTYHHLAERSDYFARARKYLRPNGRVAIIDHNGKGFFGWLFGHATPSDVIRRELEAAGYQLEREHHFLSRQNFLVFRASES